MKITYHDYELTHPAIQRWDSIPVYDDANVNVQFTRNILSVMFWVAGTDPETFRRELNEARHNLMRPRGRLYIAEAGATPSTEAVFYDSGRFGSTNLTDLQTGPKPQEFVISEGVPGDTVAQVRWTVEYLTLEIWDEQGRNRNAHTDVVLSKTSSVRYSYDEQGRQSREFSCSIIVRDDIDPNTANTAALTAARVRGCIPELPEGWRRMRVGITVSPDKLSVKVDTTDAELIAGWYWGVARVLTQNLTETYNIPLGDQQSILPIQKQFTFAVQTIKGVSRRDVINRVFMPVINAKIKFIPIEGAQNDCPPNDFPVSDDQRNGEIIHKVTWHQDFTENLIGVSIVSQVFPSELRVVESPEDTIYWLSEGFWDEEIPAEALAGGRAVADPVLGPRIEGIDYVTWIPENDQTAAPEYDRLANLSVPTRLVLDTITHEILQGDPRSYRPEDDVGGPLSIPVSVTLQAARELPVSGSTYADTAGFGKGGYVEDIEWLKVERYEESSIHGSVSKPDAASAIQRAQQNKLPILVVTQVGVAARICGRPNPRPVAFLDGDLDGRRRKLLRDDVTVVPSTANWGGRALHAVKWNYQYIVIGRKYNEGAQAITENSLRPILQKRSKANSRVYRDDLADAVNSLTTFDPGQVLDHLGFPSPQGA